MISQKLAVRFMLYVFALATVCFIAGYYFYSQGHMVSASFVWRSAIFFLILSLLYGILAMFRRV